MKKLILFFVLLHTSTAFTQSSKGFPIVSSAAGSAAIYTDTSDHWLVGKAATLLQEDIRLITGIRIPILNSLPKEPIPHLIIIGSLDKSPLIKRLAQTNKIPAGQIKGKWESFLLKTIIHPLPDIGDALVIAGSDRRGTAYGVFQLSKTLGISPWYWWADVPPKKTNELYVNISQQVTTSPAVKYRGIFINDEAPALSGWAKARYGGFSHVFYEKVFELLLRLKANYLWPAMWGNAFNDDDPLNPVLADQYGIVMGTSHHEPMLRAQQEWKRYGSGSWDYAANAPVLDSFWQKGIEHMGLHESIVTVGMRGDGDKPMEESSNIALLEKIVGKQREIISRITGKAPSATPQSWALYKEVQDYYDKGMRVPDDITLLLCDDNWGNVRKLPTRSGTGDSRTIPTAGTTTRAGGYGIYYHFDYVGGPRNYKWINTNPISRVWEQLHLTKEYGADRLWIVNVGDIKPLEFPTEFFLDYAWDPSQWPANKLADYTRDWAARQFGPAHAAAIGDILRLYTKYNGRRKPELLSPDTYSLFNYGEFQRIVSDYDTLVAKADSIKLLLPAEYRDAYYELVLYPVQASANLNKLYLTVARNRWYATQGRASTNDLAQQARQLFEKDSLLSRYYNHEVAGGKWPHMMDQTHIGYTHWQQPPYNTMPELHNIGLSKVHGPGWGLSVEGLAAWWPQDQDSVLCALPTFHPSGPQAHSIELFNRTQTPFTYTITSTAPWIRISQDSNTVALPPGTATPPPGTVAKEALVWVSVDWQKAPPDTGQAAVMIHGSDGSDIRVTVTCNRPAIAPIQTGTFIETDGYVSIEAEHYSRNTGSGGIRWLTIPDLGRTLSGVEATPVTAPSISPGNNSPHLEYQLWLSDTGAFKVQTYLAPVLEFNGKAIRYGISIDNEQPQLINSSTGNEKRDTWDQMVADNILIRESRHRISQPGKHVLKFWFADPAIVLQKLVVDFGGVRPSYLGPPESPRYGRKD